MLFNPLLETQFCIILGHTYIILVLSLLSKFLYSVFNLHEKKSVKFLFLWLVLVHKCNIWSFLYK